MKILLNTWACRSLGREVLATCIPRDLYRAYPGEHKLYVSTRRWQVWAHNPFVFSRATAINGEPLDKFDMELRFSSWSLPFTPNFPMLVAIMHQASARLGLDIPLTEPRPCVPTPPEWSDLGVSQTGLYRYWAVMPGWHDARPWRRWSPAQWRAVVGLLASRAPFICARMWQGGHCIRLKDSVNILTTLPLMLFIQGLKQSSGVLAPWSGVRHLAAALGRPCVMVTGGHQRTGSGYSKLELDVMRRFIPDKYASFPVIPHHYFTGTCCDTSKYIWGCDNACCSQPVRSPEAAADDFEQFASCMATISPSSVAATVMEIDRVFAGTGRDADELRSTGGAVHSNRGADILSVLAGAAGSEAAGASEASGLEDAAAPVEGQDEVP